MKYGFIESGALREVQVKKAGDSYIVTALGESRSVSVERTSDGKAVLASGGRRYSVDFAHDGRALLIVVGGRTFRLERGEPGGKVLETQERFAPGVHKLRSPLPGRVASVTVAPGALVKKGEPLAVLEAMKMENLVAAPADSIITEVLVAVDDLVEGGAPLFCFEVR